MTSRMASLEASSINSSDLAASSNSPKKTAQGEIKFQQVLATTREKSRKEPGNSAEDLNPKASKDTKVAINNLKPLAVKAKNDASLSTTANIDKAGRSDDHEVELENIEVNQEIELEVIENIDNANELVLAISAPQTNVAESIQNFNITVPSLDTKPVSDDENLDINEIEAANVRDTVDVDSAVSASTTGVTNAETLNKSDVKVDTLQVQVMPATLKESNVRNLHLEDSSEIDEQPASLSIVEEVAEEKASVKQENLVSNAVPASISNMQVIEQEEANNSRDQTNLQTNFARPEALKNILNKQEFTTTSIFDADIEENTATSSNFQNVQGNSKTLSGNIAPSLSQNLFNQPEDLSPLEFGAFDDGSSEFDNLFSKMDSFVSINDGKLSIDFKEIANLPEENIPHRADQISMAVRSAVGRGQSEISLRMYPEDLGAVDVRIEFSEVGKVQSIKFFATKESTLELLQKDYSILERSLKEVVNAEDASLSFNLRDGKGEGSEYQPQENFGLNDLSERSSASERIITSNYQATLQIQEDDQVDITV